MGVKLDFEVFSVLKKENVRWIMKNFAEFSKLKNSENPDF